MKTTRIINLFRVYFIENKKMLLICCIITFGIPSFIYSNEAMPEFALVVPWLVMFWIAGTFFQFSLKNNNSTHFFNLPVSAGEKFIFAIIIILIFSILMFLVALAGSYMGYYIIHPLLNTSMNEFRWKINGNPSIWEQNVEMWGGYLYYFSVFFVFLFGSIYFKKNAFLKTLVCGIGFFCGVTLYNFLLLFVTFGTTINLDIHLNIMNSSFWQNNYNIIPISVILFFLSLTYLRLRETEV